MRRKTVLVLVILNCLLGIALFARAADSQIIPLGIFNCCKDFSKVCFKMDIQGPVLSTDPWALGDPYRLFQYKILPYQCGSQITGVYLQGSSSEMHERLY